MSRKPGFLCLHLKVAMGRFCGSLDALTFATEPIMRASLRLDEHEILQGYLAEGRFVNKV